MSFVRTFGESFKIDVFDALEGKRNNCLQAQPRYRWRPSTQYSALLIEGQGFSIFAFEDRKCERLFEDKRGSSKMAESSSKKPPLSLKNPPSSKNPSICAKPPIFDLRRRRSKNLYTIFETQGRRTLLLQSSIFGPEE